MNRTPARGVKLTTVVVAVFVLAVSAMLSNYTVASNQNTPVEESQES